ncbi:MAG TPA: hypothetical protein DEQ28_04700, partial [Clostridiales bacterium]|nr:hypothetical protein [Clostridiales bacterium]
MYGIEWDHDTGGFVLAERQKLGSRHEVRPVFHEELNLLGFDTFWDYPHSEAPLLWAMGGRSYYYRGELVAEAEGGGWFSRPALKVHRPRLTLEPVQLDAMISKNVPLLQGLVQRSLKFIYQTYGRYRNQVDVVALAFSGGKDSLVILDLVQRVLEPDQFAVVFGDTGMEVRDTYLAVEAAKARWPHLTFHSARSAKDARTSWREMGPPSRIHRWCCAVHKTVPTLLLLRELTGKPSARVLVFDGIRHEESIDRAAYAAVTQGGKHRTQINASPIIAWNAGEVFLYLFGRRLLLNQAYRNGVVRVGCSVCPLASSWWNAVSWNVYQQDIICFVEELRNYAVGAGIRPEAVDAYLDAGKWKGRAGGRYLAGGGTRVVEQVKDHRISFTLREPSEDWQEWARTLGRLVRTGEGQGHIERGGIVYPYMVRHEGANVIAEVDGLAHADRFVLKAFRAVALKSAYCCHCQACQVECPTGALMTRDKVKIGDDCLACGACLDLHGEACFTAKSLETSEGGARVTGDGRKTLHTYEHFGMRTEWLSAFLGASQEWVSSNSLGNRQFDAMLVWLKHAELVASSSNKRTLAVTRLGESLASRGVGNRVTWAVIWANL